MEDTATIANVPLVLSDGAWRELSRCAEALAREVLAAEQELVDRHELHRRLALPQPITRAPRRKPAHAIAGSPRLIRFDFHHTTEGWRISEANTDVPGGLNEASGLPLLMAPHHAGTVPAGHVADEYARALLGCAPGEPRIALVHATAYSDDRQVRAFLGQCLSELGARLVQ